MLIYRYYAIKDMIPVTELGKALSDPTRVRILNLLLLSEFCVCELADALELRQSTLSTHLQTLRSVGLVETERQGVWVIYRLRRRLHDTLKGLFAEFGLNSVRSRRDLERARARLSLRVDGRCVLGPCQLDRARPKT